MAISKRPTGPKREKKSDRLLGPQVSAQEVQCDFALGPFDRVSMAMDHKWGVDVLVELVSPETAAKFGSAMAKLNAAIDERDPAMTVARAAIAIKGLEAMDREATERGAQPASDEVWLIQADGHQYGLMRDGRAWPRAQEKYPDIELVTEREMVLAILSFKDTVVRASIDAAKKYFPGAEVTAIREDRHPADQIPF